ncbi:probable magnesium transporter NIPA3 isoform X3 [Durio zibethinus]|uniref:Probable magnesium transporter n=1 Tax=Durio zibethinus TaxID=66656 RepID=A0A6P6AD58_DURZI|nr:probable magnesium transporter NIPA3 isoform X3 [Durio zibethinus]
MAAVRRWSEGMSSDNVKGLVLALSSSLFIGASFIVKKKGLKKAGASGIRAGVGGYSYLLEPLWWAGMITMVVGEIANFAAYAFAPAILVTPLGALSIIIRHGNISLRLRFGILLLIANYHFSCSAALAHIILRERLHTFGILGCVLCVVGSTTIVLHAPPERQIESVTEVWDLATEPGFLFYTALVLTAVFILIFHFVPLYGQTHIMVYIGVCSLVGSISALDTFNTAVVSPIYYVMFTSLTILASVIMFKDWDRQNPTQIITEMCGFVTILSGTFLLHKTKDMVDGPSLTTSLSMRSLKHEEEDGFGESFPLKRQDSSRIP